MARFPQSNKTTQSVDVLIKKSKSRLGNLLEHAADLQKIETLLASFLSPELAAHFQVAATRKNRLILVAPGASWATRLRMESPRLLNALHKQGAGHIEYIDIRVAPLARQSVSTRSKRPLSSAAKQALGQMAQKLEDSVK